MEITVNLWDTYKETFNTSDPDLIEAVLESFERSPFYLELKLYILHHFIDDFEYNEIDRLLKVFERNLVNVMPE
jgi:hypothetical protein